MENEQDVKHTKLDVVQKPIPFEQPEQCCNCHSLKFITMPDGQRRCGCGLRWRNRKTDRPDIGMVA